MWDVFFEKYTSCACLLGPGLNCILHWKVQFLRAYKSLFGSLCDMDLSETFQNRDVSSTKILQVDWMLSGKSLMYIKNIRGPRTDPCGTPDFINSLEEVCPWRTALW